MSTDNEQTTPVVSLDDIMEDALEVYEGELEKKAAQETAEGQPSSEDKGVTGPAEKEKGEKEDPSETAEAPAEHPETTPAPGSDKQPAKTGDFRFVSHEEAERGYKNLQGEKTRLETELKAERERREALEQSEAEKVRVQELEKDVVDYATSVNRDALKRINELDPDADDYQDKVAEIQAQTYRDIRRYEREKDEAERGKHQKVDSKKPSETGDEDLTAARKHVREVAVEKGIDPDDDYFEMVCARAPVTGEDGKPMSFDEQIAWAVEKTKHYQASLTGGTGEERAGNDGEKGTHESAAERRAREHQEENLALGRANSGRREQKRDEHESPVTLNDAIESAMEERRL